MLNILDVLKQVKNQLEVTLPLMEGRQKGSLVLDVNMTIKDWGYLTDHEKGEDYVAFIIEEDANNFFSFIRKKKYKKKKHETKPYHQTYVHSMEPHLRFSILWRRKSSRCSFPGCKIDSDDLHGKSPRKETYIYGK